MLLMNKFCIMEKIIDNSQVGKRSLQNLSCNWTGTADFGRLVPFQWNEILGTDKVITCRPKIEMQMLGFAAPTFGKIDLYVHYFYVPLRLLVDGSRDFLNNDGPLKNIELPYWTEKDFKDFWNNVASLDSRRGVFKHWTSMGLPPFWNTNETPDNSEPLTLLPFRAYQRIYWDYYRDPEVLRDDNKSNFIVTSPGHWSQPTGLLQNVMLPRLRNIKDNWIAELFATNGGAPFGADNPFGILQQSPGLVVKNENLIRTSGSENTSVQMRRIEALTRLAERMSLSGKRSIDLLFNRYGIKPEWDKLEMCQYLGGGKSTVMVKNIVSTADTLSQEDYNIGTPLGYKAGEGYSALSDVNIKFTAHEPGILMGLLSVMPHVHFVQGIGKEWRKRYRDDIFQKHLEHVGQVAVEKSEIGKCYNSGEGSTMDYDSSKDQEVFAFTEPYYEYKKGTDILAGDFMTYHTVVTSEGDQRTAQYMQSMEMYVDYPLSRTYTADNLKLDASPFNKVFQYRGGGSANDVDDHFHLCIDKDIVINRPMDGYAVPTIETTEDPHAKKTAVSGSAEL